jgi:exopolysaccharide biosynthesis polyprenyl glycosylphosphotransferase
MAKVWLYSIASCFSLAVLLAALHFSGASSLPFMGESLGLVIVLLSCQICFHLYGVDELLIESKPQIFLQKVLKSAGAGLLIAGLLFYIFPRLSPGYAVAAVSACILIFGLVVLRPIVRSVAQRQEPETTLIVGSEAMARKLYSQIVEGETADLIRVTDYAELGGMARCGAVSRIVVADPEIQGEAEAAQTLIDLKFRGVKIETAGASFERTNRKVSVDSLSPEHLIFADGYCASQCYLFIKRVMDIALAVIILILSAPMMALIACAIKFETAGPAIFSQQRVGLRGRRFFVHKFRSMRQDAEQHTGPTWAKKDDDRVTRSGAFLRKCRLDELPQLWNVLCGDMSLIGPRPERPYFVELLQTKIPYFDLRHYVKPGITGWAQVMYPYGASVEDARHKLEYDLYYAKNLSLRLDLFIAIKTIAVMLRAEGR